MIIIQRHGKIRIVEDDIALDILLPKRYARLLRDELNSEELCD